MPVSASPHSTTENHFSEFGVRFQYNNVPAALMGKELWAIHTESIPESRWPRLRTNPWKQIKPFFVTYPAVTVLLQNNNEGGDLMGRWWQRMRVEMWKRSAHFKRTDADFICQSLCSSNKTHCEYFIRAQQSLHNLICSVKKSLEHLP